MKKRFPILMCSCVSLCASASPGRPVDVPGMVAASELIVVGRAGETANAVGVGIHDFVVADRVLKGRLPANTRSVDIVSTSFQNTGTAPYGIFFLRHVTGGFQVVDTAYPYLVASPTAKLAANSSRGASDSDVQSRVAEELCNVFGLPEKFVTDRKSGLRQPITLVGEPVGEDANGEPIIRMQPPSESLLAEEVYQLAFDSLDTIAFSYQQRCLAGIVDTSPATIGSVWALAAMLKWGDRSRISAHLTSLLNLPDQKNLTGDAVRDGLGRMPVSLQDVPLLISLLHSVNRYVRDVAASKLEEIGSVEAISALQVSLQDQVGWNRRHAAGLICAVTHECDAKKALWQSPPTQTKDIEAALARWLAKKRTQPG